MCLIMLMLAYNYEIHKWRDFQVENRSSMNVLLGGRDESKYLNREMYYYVLYEHDEYKIHLFDFSYMIIQITIQSIPLQTLHNIYSLKLVTNFIIWLPKQIQHISLEFYCWCRSI